LAETDDTIRAENYENDLTFQETELHSKTSLFLLELIRVEDNPDQNMEIKEIFPQFSICILKDTWDLVARGLSSCVEGSWRTETKQENIKERLELDEGGT
jgi:hypothetical protein